MRPALLLLAGVAVAVKAPKHGLSAVHVAEVVSGVPVRVLVSVMVKVCWVVVSVMGEDGCGVRVRVIMMVIVIVIVMVLMIAPC